MQKRMPLILSVVVLLAVVYVLDGINLPTQSRLWREATNAGHAPLFGVLSIAMLVFAKRFMRRTTEQFHYFIAAGVVASFVGGLTEFIQYFTPRDASVLDMIYNELGITSFLLFAATIDPKMQQYPLLKSLAGRNWVRLGSVLIVSCAFISFATITLAHARRQAQFPVISNFDSYLDHNFVLGSNATIDFVDPPTEWNSNKSDGVVRWHSDGKLLSALTIQYPYPVWTGYSSFHFEIFSDEQRDLHVFLRINDVAHNFEYDDRYNSELTVKPGLNQFTVSLADVVDLPDGRQMDMTSIANIILFTSGRQAPHTLYVDNIELK